MTPATPVATNWIAIIGAPSSGKSSVIAALAARGYAVEEEVARAYIEERLARGDLLADIRGPDGVKQMQRDIFARTLARNEALDPRRLIFFDRGLGDAIFYFTRAGLDPAPVWDIARRHRYRAVFMMERLPMTADDVRTEDDAAAQQMQQAFYADYTALGYAVTAVPVMPVAARADFILRCLDLPALSPADAIA